MWLICLQVRLELPAWAGGLGYEHVPMTSITLTQSARRFSISTVQGAFCFFDSYFSFFFGSKDFLPISQQIRQPNLKLEQTYHILVLVVLKLGTYCFLNINMIHQE